MRDDRSWACVHIAAGAPSGKGWHMLGWLWRNRCDMSLITLRPVGAGGDMPAAVPARSTCLHVAVACAQANSVRLLLQISAHSFVDYKNGAGQTAKEMLLLAIASVESPSEAHTLMAEAFREFEQDTATPEQRCARRRAASADPRTDSEAAARPDRASSVASNASSSADAQPARASEIAADANGTSDQTQHSSSNGAAAPEQNPSGDEGTAAAAAAAAMGEGRRQCM